MWLSVENIQEKEGTVIADLPDVPTLVGSGQSVGGVVSETVGASSAGENSTLQVTNTFICYYFVFPNLLNDNIFNLSHKKDM